MGREALFKIAVLSRVKGRLGHWDSWWETHLGPRGSFWSLSDQISCKAGAATCLPFAPDHQVKFKSRRGTEMRQHWPLLMTSSSSQMDDKTGDSPRGVAQEGPQTLRLKSSFLRECLHWAGILVFLILLYHCHYYQLARMCQVLWKIVISKIHQSNHVPSLLPGTIPWSCTLGRVGGLGWLPAWECGGSRGSSSGLPLPLTAVSHLSSSLDCLCYHS